MCSIFSILDIKSDASELRQVALEMSKLLRHRGPDWSGIYADDKAILAHERLAIVDVDHGAAGAQDAKHRYRILQQVGHHDCYPITLVQTAVILKECCEVAALLVKLTIGECLAHVGDCRQVLVGCEALLQQILEGRILVDVHLRWYALGVILQPDLFHVHGLLSS